MTTQPLIALKNIKKVFDDDSAKHLVAVENINLDIYPGEFFVFLGPSGSGKSTLLRIMSRLEHSFDGELVFAPGVTPNDFSFVFQHFALLPWLSVRENVGLGLETRKLPDRERHAIIEKELRTFGLEKFRESRPRELSGGMRQRVGIARALATEPKVIFMDEPFSEIDSFTAEELRKELLAIWQEQHPTIVMVTHMIEEAIELADRIAVMTQRPGRIEKILTNTLARPREKRSAPFYAVEDELQRLIAP